MVISLGILTQHFQTNPGFLPGQLTPSWPRVASSALGLPNGTKPLDVQLDQARTAARAARATSATKSAGVWSKIFFKNIHHWSSYTYIQSYPLNMYIYICVYFNRCSEWWSYVHQKSCSMLKSPSHHTIESPKLHHRRPQTVDSRSDLRNRVT